MKKKLLAVLAIFTVVGAAASAQLMVGVSGNLPMSTSMTAEDIANAFQKGSGDILYGGFVELGMGNLGIGVSATANTYEDEILGGMKTVNADVYVSYHLFKAKAFLDPFAELGYGLMGTMYGNWDEVASMSKYVDASYYWYAALGAGINLGSLGVSGKFAWCSSVADAVQYKDEYGTSQPLQPYGTSRYGIETLYPMRFTLAAKLIL